MAAEPIVNGLESEYSDRLIVLRVNVQSPAGKELSAHYNSRGTPTFIFFGPGGVERWRTFGTLDPDRVINSLEQ